jgi:hypothetical protein
MSAVKTRLCVRRMGRAKNSTSALVIDGSIDKNADHAAYFGFAVMRFLIFSKTGWVRMFLLTSSFV